MITYNGICYIALPLLFARRYSITGTSAISGNSRSPYERSQRPRGMKINGKGKDDSVGGKSPPGANVIRSTERKNMRREHNDNFFYMQIAKRVEKFSCRTFDRRENFNGGEKKMIQNVCTHITSKRIELESPGCSGFIRF